MFAISISKTIAASNKKPMKLATAVIRLFIVKVFKSEKRNVTQKPIL